MAPPKNPRDFAVVLGINRYRRLNPLQGALGDAADFRDWLTAPEGGGLLPENIFPRDSFKDDGSEPTAIQLAQPFVELRKLARAEKLIGRRLYIFLSGHGAGDLKEPDKTAFLAATWEQLDQGYILGEMYAAAFWAERRFEEIILFMDCCRERGWTLSGYPYYPWPAPADTGSPDRVNRCYAYAVGFGLKAKEHAWDREKKTYRGVFAKALIEALRDGRAADENGEVTHNSLREYLEGRVRQLSPDQDRPQEAKFTVWEKMMFAKHARPPRTTIRLTLRSGPIENLIVRAGILLSRVHLDDLQRLAGDLYQFSLAPRKAYDFVVCDLNGRYVTTPEPVVVYEDPLDVSL